MKRFFFLTILLLVLVSITRYQVGWLTERPVALKLGYTPPAEVQRLLAGEHRLALSEAAVIRVLFYFGSLVDKWKNQVILPPEYFNMYKTVETAVKLDPYNMDAYYFAQSAFTWEVGRAREVNVLLDYGMKYRTRDWYLPFFAGFNSAFFLQEYDQAAQYMEKAAQLSGNPLFTGLASRFFYESGRTQLGISYLQGMIQQEQDPQQKRVYELRFEALVATSEIENALVEWRKSHETDPQTIAGLHSSGYLEKIPLDPYGGVFFLDEEGRVRTTSKFAFMQPSDDAQRHTPKETSKAIE